MPKRELIEEYMLVWDDKEDFAVPRLVLFKNEDGSCVCVYRDHNEKYFNNEHFGTCSAKYCKPLPKKTKRLMNEAEFMDLRKENPQIVFRDKPDNDYETLWGTYFSQSNFRDRSKAQYSLDLVNWNDFYVEVEE